MIFWHNWIILSFLLPRLVLSYSRQQCATDTPLLRSCRYLRRSMVSALINFPQIEYYWYVSSSISSFTYRLSWFDEEVERLLSSRCHMQLPWWGGSLMLYIFPYTSGWPLVQLSWLLPYLYVQYWTFLSGQHHPLSTCLTVDYKQDNLGGWCQYMVGGEVGYFSSWKRSGWFLRMKVWNLPM